MIEKLELVLIKVGEERRERQRIVLRVSGKRRNTNISHCCVDCLIASLFVLLMFSRTYALGQPKNVSCLILSARCWFTSLRNASHLVRLFDTHSSLVFTVLVQLIIAVVHAAKIVTNLIQCLPTISISCHLKTHKKTFNFVAVHIVFIVNR